MNGIIFLACEDFIVERLGLDGWDALMAKAGLSECYYQPDQSYPDAEAEAIFSAMPELLELSREESLIAFGRHMAPGLVEMAQAMGLIGDDWTTMDILEFVPDGVHGVLAEDDPDMDPPDMRTLRLKHGEIAIAYMSKRRLCHMIRGIIQGLGEMYDEPLAIEEPVCMHHGGLLCRMSVRIDDPYLVRYVDIPREFELVRSRIAEITFYNRYKGVPIISSGLVLKYSEEEVLIQTDREQLLAMKMEGVTHLTLPHMHLGIKARVDSVDIKKCMAVLYQVVLADGVLGRRRQTRIKPHKTILIRLRHKFTEYQGEILDLSVSGLSMEVETSDKLNELVLFAPVRMAFSLPMNSATDLDCEDRSEDESIRGRYLALDGNCLNVEERQGKNVLRVVFGTLIDADRSTINDYISACTRQFQAIRDLKDAFPEYSDDE
ncbi:MAG: heme NO-binding domain-containing protein [Magnetococcales bacterium]|nr:heme NO-binding domain-containing protein [Magnetococcales bacterium]